MLQTILVPTDGSDHANKAVDLAADLAEKYDGRVVILHVLLRHTSASDLKVLCQELGADEGLMQKLSDIEDAYVDTAMAAYGPVPMMVPDDALKLVGEAIAGAAKSRAEAKGAEQVSAEVVDGAPADIILKAAEQEKADAIVMGSRGLANISGLLLGSVSHKVANHAACTCITVK
ncbi:MAG: universal stress protein [Rhodospirillales bacterium]|mgnify:CR=1 FL=1|jgi:nucleotide-binding universal stress UspA family protein|nr:universal stress protein UspA [Rhodospirillaceae bacterium]MDP6428898.1 universal stress protein [Rhodospirillales bacterium]MDP6644729.1 universal stress protein [Rhodospirillales bacterium]MDP6840461.1 universal stress protein [Rhodospirillales bacterium]